MSTETLPELEVPRQESPFGYPPRDEVSAIDLWHVLVKRRRMVAAVFALSLGAGVAQALLTKASYTYHTVVEIGHDGSGKPLDSTDTVLAKLNQAYIPQTLRDYAEKNQSRERVRIDARVPKGSELVVLESRGPADLAPVYLLLQGAVADTLIQDHQRTIDQIDRQYKAELTRARVRLDELQDQRIFAVQEKALQGEIARGKRKVESLKDQATLLQYKAELSRAHMRLDELQDQRIFTVQEKALQGEIARGKQRIESLKDQATLLEAQQKRLDETKSLLVQQIAEAKAIVAVAGESRGKAVTEATDEAKAMTLLMINSSIAESRSRVAGLEERLYIGIENERERLGKQLADGRRDQATEAGTVVELESKFVKLRVDHERDIALQQQAITEIEAKITKFLADDRREQATEAGTVGELEGKLVKLRVDHERDIALQQQAIAEIEAKIAALRGTHPLLAPMQSLEPTGTGRRFIVAVAAVLGLIGGLFLVFVVEFLQNARNETRRIVPEF